MDFAIKQYRFIIKNLGIYEKSLKLSEEVLFQELTNGEVVFLNLFQII